MRSNSFYPANYPETERIILRLHSDAAVLLPVVIWIIAEYVTGSTTMREAAMPIMAAQRQHLPLKQHLTEGLAALRDLKTSVPITRKNVAVGYRFLRSSPLGAALLTRDTLPCVNFHPQSEAQTSIIRLMIGGLYWPS